MQISWKKYSVQSNSNTYEDFVKDGLFNYAKNIFKIMSFHLLQIYFSLDTAFILQRKEK